MIEWQGIAADTADVDETSGVSALQLNTRMRIDGELQRRYGMLSTGLPPLDGPILYLASGSGFVVRGTATNVEGNTDPVDIPVGPKRKPPIIDVIRQGSGWTLSTFGQSLGPNTYTAGPASCSGSISYTILAAQTTTLTTSRTVSGGGVGASYIVDVRTVTGPVSGAINVPWDIDFRYITAHQTNWASLVGASAPGCGI
jgi:hypothetical protein